MNLRLSQYQINNKEAIDSRKAHAKEASHTKFNNGGIVRATSRATDAMVGFNEAMTQYGDHLVRDDYIRRREEHNLYITQRVENFKTEPSRFTNDIIGYQGDTFTRANQPVNITIDYPQLSDEYLAHSAQQLKRIREELEESTYNGTSNTNSY
jgi:hypothetical protein